MQRFLLPDIGEGVVEAEVLAWRVREGEVVAEGEILVELLTDKAEIEIPSPYAGRVHKLCYDVGNVVPVGAVLIEIAEDGEVTEATADAEAGPRPARADTADSVGEIGEVGEVDPLDASEPPAAAATAAAEAAAPPDQPPGPPARPRSARRASPPGPPAPRERGEAVPAVRELARRLGVDLAQLRGTGPRGRIMRRDVEAFQAEGGTAPAGPVAAPIEPAQDLPDWERSPLRGLRRTIARRMSQARHTAAHFTYVDEVDMTDLLERVAAVPGATTSPLAYIAHAVVRVLTRHPRLNASIDDAREEIVLKRVVHLGIATATEQGLVVPVIRDAAEHSVAELAAEIERLAQGARSGDLAAEALRGSTFTITSLGKLGGLVSTPIVNYPEVAILGVNAIRRVPAVYAERIAIRQRMNLSLSVDHRIADGGVAAEFVRDVRELLEGVDFPALEGDEMSARVEHELGVRMRRLREEHGLELDELAARLGMPRERLADYEEGRAAPSVGELAQLAQALDIGIGSFFQRAVSERRVEVVRSAERWSVEPQSEAARSLNYRYQSLSYTLTDKLMAPFLVEVPPDEASAVAPSHHDGEEFLFVLSGQLEVTVGGEVHRLGPGDAIYYDSRMEHTLRAVEGAPARLLACIAQPRRPGVENPIRRAFASD